MAYLTFDCVLVSKERCQAPWVMCGSHLGGVGQGKLPQATGTQCGASLILKGTQKGCSKTHWSPAGHCWAPVCLQLPRRWLQMGARKSELSEKI